MPQIHPTALVDPHAELADDVVVGPGCIIQGPVRIGSGTHLIAHVYLQGPLIIGQRNTLYPYVCLGLAPQDRKFDPQVSGAGIVIGDDNILREGVTIHRATGNQPTRLGSGCYLMVNSHIGHDAQVGNAVTLVNGALVAGHVEIADQVILSGNAVVHQFVRIGRLAMIAGVQGVTQDVPPFCIVYNSRRVGSLNIIGLRRAGYRASIPALQQAFDLLYRRGLPNQAAAQAIEQQLGHDPLCRELAQFVRSTRRGITRLDERAADIDDFHAGPPE